MIILKKILGVLSYVCAEVGVSVRAVCGSASPPPLSPLLALSSLYTKVKKCKEARAL